MGREDRGALQETCSFLGSGCSWIRPNGLLCTLKRFLSNRITKLEKDLGGLLLNQEGPGGTGEFLWGIPDVLDAN